jgi:hypothetical protein
MSKKLRKYGRLSDDAKQEIIDEIRRYGRGEAGPKLTWPKIVEFSGFSKPTLSRHPEIRREFEAAKEALRNAPPNRVHDADDFGEMQAELERLRKRVHELEAQQARWKARWQRIAYNIRQSGMQMHLIDRPADGDGPSEKETEQILRPFDKEIPPTR